jgi:tRNA pseudouridine55 synthase
MMTQAIQALPAHRVALDGVLNVKKEAGWTSHDVVAKVRGCLGGWRVGHAGTLDPAAVGVLPLLLGQATRIAEYLLDWDKEYLAMLRLGETTDTQDATGTVLDRRPTEQLSEEAVRTAVERFRGQIRQLPPMYSAVKVAGVPLYKSARAGRTVRREARDVLVRELDVQAILGRDVSLRVTCSKGTYIRTLCADIGEALGVGGHLLRLERTRVGPLCIDDAVPVRELCEAQASGQLASLLLPMGHALTHLPEVTVTEAAADRVRHGVAVGPTAIVWPQDTRPVLLPHQSVRLTDRSGRLVGIGTVPAVSLDAVGCLIGSIKVAKVLRDG